MTHGVISDTELIYRRGTERLTRVPLQNTDIVTLLSIATEHKLHSMWICPGTRLSHDATTGYVESVEAIGYEHSEVAYTTTSRGGKKRIKRAHIWQNGGTRADRKNLYLIFPEWELWKWKETDALSILAGIHYVEKALGVSISQGPAMAGRQLMQATHSKSSHAEWIRKPDIDMSTMPYHKAGRDCEFKAANIEYKPGLYLHAYDKNSMYLGAIKGAVLGAGTPVYYGMDEKKEINFKFPGLWHCTIDTQDSKYNGIDKPSPLYKGQKWLTTPLVKLCLDLGYSVELVEGYEWKEYHRTLEEWGTRLWYVRSTIKEDTTNYPHERGRILAYGCIKRIATTGLGLLNSQSSYKYCPEWYRPDFWATVVELAKERIIRNAINIENKYGMTPIAIDTDCLYYISPDSNPHTAIPDMTVKADGLGGYKVKHSIKLTPELARDMQSSTSGSDIARVAREHEEMQKGLN